MTPVWLDHLGRGGKSRRKPVFSFPGNENGRTQLPRVIHGRKPTIKPESWYARPDLLEQVLALATPVVGGRGKAFKWMEEPNPYLNGQLPIDLVDTEAGASQVIDYIRRYELHRARKDAP